MRPYPKIETAFERDESFKVDPNKVRSPIVESINLWRASEKVDGTNVRIHFENGEHPQIAGRTDNAQLHVGLLAHLNNLIKRIESEVNSIMKEYLLDNFTLYGEGYGAKIQTGGNYRSDQGFILFDALTGNKWLKFDQVQDTGNRLDIPVVPDFGVMSWDSAISLVHDGFMSRCAEKEYPAEGLVLRTVEPLYDNRGRRIIVKLKTKDFA